MWTYVQLTGKIFDQVGKCIEVGYSGAGIHKNNPTSQHLKNLGPIPCGEWRFEGEPANTGPHHGPYVIRLTPLDENAVFGRDGFLIHGDNKTHTASQGCIILSRAAREALWNSGDHRLLVVPTDPVFVTPASGTQGSPQATASDGSTTSTE